MNHHWHETSIEVASGNDPRPRNAFVCCLCGKGITAQADINPNLGAGGCGPFSPTKPKGYWIYNLPEGPCEGIILTKTEL